MKFEGFRKIQARRAFLRDFGELMRSISPFGMFR